MLTAVCSPSRKTHYCNRCRCQPPLSAWNNVRQSPPLSTTPANQNLQPETPSSRNRTWNKNNAARDRDSIRRKKSKIVFISLPTVLSSVPYSMPGTVPCRKGKCDCFVKKMNKKWNLSCLGLAKIAPSLVV